MDPTIDAVKRYYDENAQLEWERLERHPFEFVLTTYMMDRYIKPGQRILDIGGGPGRYSIYYAGKGCDVTLVDLSQGNITLAKEKADKAGVGINACAKNCLELDQLGLGQFDHVLMMGPMYHITQDEQRRTAMSTALSHLKPGGLVYVSFIMPFAGFIYDLKNEGCLEKDLSNPEAGKLLELLVAREDYTGPAFTTARFCHPAGIPAYMESFGLKRLHFFGQEGILAPNEYELAKRSLAERELWIEVAKHLLELPEYLCYSEHAMFIGQKP